MRVVVANRGEVAVRVVRTARELGYETVVLHTAEDSRSRAARLADTPIVLPGSGAAGYLDIDSVVRAAAACGRGALVHPGYGFLSESAEFATACGAAELIFVGPSPEVLRVFGDKVAAREAAEAAGATLLPATKAGVSADEVAAFLADHPGGVMVKAAAGGGGRGMRPVTDPTLVAEAVERCRAEALAGFGDDSVYAEALVTRARHIEVQVVADGLTAVALGDRDCSVQRRRQKLVEIAPAPDLPVGVRDRVHREAVLIAEAVGCRGVVTVEFLVEGTNVWFLEVNPRLQVEHTVTEAVTGVDLVAVQLDLARGRTLAELELPKHETLGGAGQARGWAVQARVNAELLAADGTVLPSTGVLTRFDAPTGFGVRVDTAAQVGMRQGVRFDSLLAKIIAQASSFPAALQRCSDALAETVIGGVDTNLPLLRAVLAELSATGPVTTDWFEEQLDELRTRAEGFEDPTPPRTHEQTGGDAFELTEDEQGLRSPMGATVVSLAAPGTVLATGAEVAVLEAMKMQHVLRASEPLRVLRHAVAPGEVVDPL
ncbi:ATP-binding protein, partial [Nocardia sp. NPDC004722]